MFLHVLSGERERECVFGIRWRISETEPRINKRRAYVIVCDTENCVCVLNTMAHNKFAYNGERETTRNEAKKNPK